MTCCLSLKKYFQTYAKTIFWTALFCILFAHGYAMCNLVGNNDTMGIISGYAGAGTSSGRWLLDILVKTCQLLFGDVYFLPWFNLLLGFFLIACSAFLILYSFQAESKAAIVLVTALMIVFPAATSMALYGYTFHFNMLSLLLSVCCAALCLKANLLFHLLAAFLLALSLGIYQAYLPFTCAILVLSWIKNLSDGSSCKRVIRSILWDGATILLGLILYFSLTKLFCALFHISLSSYRGIDRMTVLPPFKSLLFSTAYSFGILFLLPFKNLYGISTPLILRIMIFIYYLLSILAVIHLYKKNTQGLTRKLLLTFLLFLLPPSSNLIFFMVNADKDSVYTAMLYGTVAIFLFLPLFFQQSSLKPFTKRIICITISGMVFLWGWFSNGVYTASHHIIEQNIAVWNRIITEVESLDGYHSQMPVCIVGEHPYFPSVIESYDEFHHLVSLHYVVDWSLPHFLKNYLGWEKDFSSAPPSLPDNLPVYPDAGSIIILDNVVIIHFK
ncbi:MAG: hypothetical protein HFG59_01030 [Lachnospiraceae bacterium]|nr:hypothetical protein [Lachnospiraceae bacterium]